MNRSAPVVGRILGSLAAPLKTGSRASSSEMPEEDSGGFARFAIEARDRLEPAFIARYGAALAPDILAEVLAYAWQHQADLSGMGNPIGYLYRVGRTRARSVRRSMGLARVGVGIVFPSGQSVGLPDVHPELHRELRQLSDGQRVAVVLTFAYGWTLRDVSELTGQSLSTVIPIAHEGCTSCGPP